LKTLRDHDWMAVTSPSSARLLMQGLARAGADVRSIPRILAAGPGTADALTAFGLIADAVPETDFGAVGAAAAAARSIPAGSRLLRLRSREAGPELAEQLGALGLAVTDCILYEQEPVTPERVPPFDAAFFASASAVHAYFALGNAVPLDGRSVVAMGRPTVRALEEHGIGGVLTPAEPSVEGALQALAAARIQEGWATS
jgi:uroporphyrinogen-III synthase